MHCSHHSKVASKVYKIDTSTTVVGIILGIFFVGITFLNLECYYQLQKDTLSFSVDGGKVEIICIMDRINDRVVIRTRSDIYDEAFLRKQ